MPSLVVGRNSNIDEFGWRVGIAEGDDRDIDVRSLLDGLSIGTRVSDDDKAGLLEGSSDVIGERSWSETTSDGLSSGMSSELEDSTLTVWTSGNGTNIGGVVDGNDYSGSEDNLLPKSNTAVLGPPQTYWGLPCARTKSFQC